LKSKAQRRTYTSR